jgi:hypothetical protein
LLLLNKDYRYQPLIKFGGTEFNEWFFNDVEETIELVEKILKETDFKTQLICYRSSW